MGEDYEFDLAFSYLEADGEMAFQLYELLSERVKCFIYTEEQKKLAGTNGEDVLNNVFSKEARIVAILFRKEWGSTPWTKIEETAIRNRGFEEGYDFTMFIPLDHPVNPPKWLPKNRIWIGLDRWGLKGAATALESRIVEAFGKIKVLTASKQAEEFKRTQALRVRRDSYLANRETFLDAKNEMLKIMGRLKEIKEELTDTSVGLIFPAKTSGEQMYQITYSKGAGIRFTYFYVNSNAIESHLDIELYNVTGYYPVSHKETLIEVLRLVYDKTLDERIGWSEINKRQMFFTTDQLTDQWMKKFMKEVDRLNERRATS